MTPPRRPGPPAGPRPAAILLGALCAVTLAASADLAPGLRAQTDDVHTQGATTGTITESADAMKVTTIIQCFCGTCVNQTLHECTCGFAERERNRVAAALAAGSTPEQLIARYMQENGPQVRIVPERRGLNLIGWAVPFAASLAGFLALGIVLWTWRKRAPLAAAAGPDFPAPLSDADRGYFDRLERELKEMD